MDPQPSGPPPPQPQSQVGAGSLPTNPQEAAAALHTRFAQLRSAQLHRFMQNIQCDAEDVAEVAPPYSSQKPWGFASKAERFAFYLSQKSKALSSPGHDPGHNLGHSGGPSHGDSPWHGHATSSEDTDSEGYMAHLRASRAFFSPHSSEAMAEALGAEQVFEGLSGSLLMPGLSGLHDLRQHLKQLIDRSWSDEALRHGVGYANAGKYPDAIKSYNRALELCPSNQDARVARGAAQANQQSYADAIADFEAALQQDPKNQNAASYLAAVRVAAEAHRKAGAAASRQQSKENSAAADSFWQSLDPQDPAVLPGALEHALAVVKSHKEKRKKGKKEKHKKEKRARSREAA